MQKIICSKSKFSSLLKKKKLTKKSAIKLHLLFICHYNGTWQTNTQKLVRTFRKIPQYFAREVSNSFSPARLYFTNYLWKNVIFNSLTIKFLLLCKTIRQYVTNDNVSHFRSPSLAMNCITFICVYCLNISILIYNVFNIPFSTSRN